MTNEERDDPKSEKAGRESSTRPCMICGKLPAQDEWIEEWVDDHEVWGDVHKRCLDEVQ